MTPEQLAELERLAEAATPAPWWIDGLGDLLCRDGRVLGEHYGGPCLVPDESDAAFIAASRTAVPALIAALRAERARSARLAKLLERSGAMLRDLMASYETSWPDRSEILARIAAALAEK